MQFQRGKSGGARGLMWDHQPHNHLIASEHEMDTPVAPRRYAAPASMGCST
eukprot:CAMPEP_0198716794 /NCGR_PEP_ID=MMETSP1471-20131121/40276_1 /TAXON_ID=41880 /ORGANISM="Pycnococcus provasolii, Strain RCC733" /LENGTH=50 /DNA_ID=CAMNT_0044477339 /DNA_START=70 /DNA_END=220 /DNA_ORIENTATION=-